MKGFIDVSKCQIRLRGKAKGMYLLPMKNKEELIEEQFANFDDPIEDAFFEP